MDYHFEPTRDAFARLYRKKQMGNLFGIVVHIDLRWNLVFLNSSQDVWNAVVRVKYLYNIFLKAYYDVTSRKSIYIEYCDFITYYYEV